MLTEELQADLSFAENIVETVREPLLILDEHLHVIKANESFYRTFQVSPDETLHRLIYHLGNRQWNIPALRDLLERILPEDGHFDNFEVEHTFETIGRRTMLVNARRVVQGGEKILLAIEDITERKQAEAAKFFLASVIESSQDGIVTVDFDGIITTWNKAAERIYGYSAAELVGQSLQILSTPEEKIPLFTYLDKIRQGAPVEYVEIERVTKDGRRLWLSVQFSPIKDATGKIVGISTISRDVTEHHNANAALTKSEGVLQQAISGKTVGVFFFNLNGRMTDANETFTRMCGYTREELLGSVHWKMLTSPDFYEATFRTAENLATRGETSPYEKKMVRKDGSHWWGLFAPVVLNFRGWDSDCMEFVVDITERKKAELALRESSERYHALFNSIDEGFCVIEMLFKNGTPHDYRFLEINPAFEKHTGLKNAQGKRMREMVPNHDKRWFEIYGKIALTGEPTRFEQYGRALGRWFDVSAFRIGNPEERKVAVLFTDITERKKAEKTLEQTVVERTAALQEINNQMESFTYTIAHDLRAPLRAQQGFANALLDEYGSALGETGRDYAERIIASAARLNNLVNDLLTYSRIDRTELTLEKINVRNVVRDICSEMAFQIHEANAKVHIGELHFRVCGHEPTFRTAVTNLIQNAIKFSRTGVTPEVRIWAEERGKNVRLWIEDNGIGISPEHQHQIFGVFHRLHKMGDYPGTGVGLAIVQKGVERMGGHVGVESQEGQGSRFWIELEKVNDAQATRR